MSDFAWQHSPSSVIPHLTWVPAEDDGYEYAHIDVDDSVFGCPIDSGPQPMPAPLAAWKDMMATAQATFNGGLLSPLGGAVLNGKYSPASELSQGALVKTILVRAGSAALPAETPPIRLPWDRPRLLEVA